MRRAKRRGARPPPVLPGGRARLANHPRARLISAGVPGSPDTSVANRVTLQVTLGRSVCRRTGNRANSGEIRGGRMANGGCPSPELNPPRAVDFPMERGQDDRVSETISLIVRALALAWRGDQEVVVDRPSTFASVAFRLPGCGKPEEPRTDTSNEDGRKFQGMCQKWVVYLFDTTCGKPCGKGTRFGRELTQRRGKERFALFQGVMSHSSYVRCVRGTRSASV
jgi:hypothetical protein